MRFRSLIFICPLCLAMIRLADTCRLQPSHHAHLHVPSDSVSEQLQTSPNSPGAGAALIQMRSTMHSNSKGPTFTAPAMAPQQFLMISSPTEKKVTWTTLKNFESQDGRTFALIDSGLSEPKGMAFDHNKGFLYIADSGAKKIFRYTILADTSGPSPTLTTSGVRLTIVEGHPVEWVTVDEVGNLFYTAPDTNNINKIQASVMDTIAKGEMLPSALQIISQKTIEAEMASVAKQQLAEKKSGNSSDDLPSDPPTVLPHILSIYEAKLNPHVSKPAALWADGADLYWTNQEDGTTAGTIVKGKVFPKSVISKNGPQPFPAESITNMSSVAYGLAKASKAMFFSRPGKVEGTGVVTGLLLGTDISIDFVKSIATPRGLVWDQDQTMYVADESSGKVWSFPTGRMMSNVPITRAVTMAGAYGLVILSTDDPAFKENKVEGDGMVAEMHNMATKVTMARASLQKIALEKTEHASFFEFEAPSFLRSSSNRVQCVGALVLSLALFA